MYWEGIVLRMTTKDSVKHIQNKRNIDVQPKTEYQTFRIFAILGALTIMFVLLIKLAQNGSGLQQATPRQPSNSLGTSVEPKR